VRDADLKGTLMRNENDPKKRKKELKKQQKRFKTRPSNRPILINLETGKGIISMSNPRATTPRLEASGNRRGDQTEDGSLFQNKTRL
jgi:hypothetical protein